MRQAFNIILIFALVNVLALLLVAPVTLIYLASTGRMSQDRWDRAVALFSPTVEEAQAARAEAEKAEAEKQAMREEASRLESVSRGTLSVEDRILARQEVEAVRIALIERLQADNEAMRRLLENLRRRVDDQKAELDAREAAFERARKEYATKMADAQFRQTVEMYENLPPKQGRAMFLDLIANGKQDHVVDYLMAMDGRKAAGILREFKQDGDVPVATALLEKLRQRGADFVDQAVASAAAGNEP